MIRTPSIDTRRSERGMTLLEMLVAVTILGLSMIAAAYFVSASYHGTKHNNDKSIATQRSISILEELKSLVEINNGGQDVTLLDDYDDGITYNPILTTETGIADPSHPTSGNVRLEGGWKYERQVSVQKFASLQTNDVRLVNVRVYGNTDGKRHLLAETASVIRTIADEFPPSQVFDLYIVAIENVPGWWVYMSNLIPFVANAVQDLQARNPGLEFRTHWIRTLSYGRDRQYTPYMNRASDSTQDIDDVYFYPATMPAGQAVSTYYVPTGMRGQIDIDGTVENGYDAATNPMPYTLADHFNHAMRLEDERALFNTRVALGLEDAQSPTYRLLLEDMYSNPENYKNAIIINVHGELFPFPPIRNYSDPAKDPEDHPNVRVVTHPENLTWENGEDIELRVYSYLTDPSAATTPDQALTEPISVMLEGIPTTANITVQEMEGGDGVGYSGWVTSQAPGVDSTGMAYEIVDSPGGAVVRLYRSPLTARCTGGNCLSGGLQADKRLYGMEYIPTMCGWDLDDTVGPRPRNTARWKIIIDSADVPIDTRLAFQTRIGTDMTTGTMYPTANEPSNLSRTYAWRGSNTWLYGDGTQSNPGNLPLTERFQIIGDPRHNPYEDLRDAFNAVTNPVGMGYNRYFDDFENWSVGLESATDSTTWWGGWYDDTKINTASATTTAG